MGKITWRLLTTHAADGPTNMAIDQAIMEAVAAERVFPTLRFYAWTPPCLSLGYTQPIGDVAQERLVERDWHLVRRLTGGRAILHTDELTYSIAIRANDPIVAGDVVASYRRLSRALLDGLHHLGASAEAEKRDVDPINPKGPVCFEIPHHYEITAESKKLIGSAQVRKFGAVLQHGSLPLTGDIARICDALAFQGDHERDSARERVRRRATTLEDVLGHDISWEQAVSAMVDGFRATFGLVLVTDELSPEEQLRAADLRTQQYITEEWNARF